MGGFVALRSRMGDGSCFSFELEFPADDSHDREVDELRRRLEGRRVLLTSRSNPLREMIARRLTANGLVAVAADSSNDPASYEVVVADAEEAPDPSRPPTPRVALEDPFTGVVETSTAAVGLQQPFLGIDLIRALDAAVNVATNRAEEAVAPASTIESDWSAMNVLLVEDNPVNQLVAADMLRRCGPNVAVADDGREAVAAAAENRFDLILMDVQMPVLDGMGATREIRAAEARDGVRTLIYAMTALAQDADRDNCLEAGMDGFITKPLKMTDLAGVLRAAAGTKKQPTPT
ncbi:MAG: response regulator, partial [Planctomycetia bacterium]